MSWIISAIPSITWARVITWAPACIWSATLLPSRAPSRMKSEISATASGWLSLTPRSSRRRATMAAMAISSLSFSRGVRCMCASIDSESRQRCAVKRAQHSNEITPQHRTVASAQPRDRDAVPARHADLAAKISGAHGLDLTLVAGHAQHGRDRAAAGRRGRRGEPAGDRTVEPQGLGEDELAAAADPPTVGDLAVVDRLSHGGAAEHECLGHEKRGALLHVDIDAARQAGAVEQDRLLWQPAQPRATRQRELDGDGRRGSEGAIDFSRRRGADHEPPPLLPRDRDVEAVPARHAARGIHQNGLELLPRP